MKTNSLGYVLWHINEGSDYIDDSVVYPTEAEAYAKTLPDYPFVVEYVEEDE